MYKLEFTRFSSRKYSKLIKNNRSIKDRLNKAFKLLSDDPFSQKLRTHKVLSRKYGKVNSSRVTGDLRIVWVFKKGGMTVLEILDIGGHSGKRKVYK